MKQSDSQIDTATLMANTIHDMKNSLSLILNTLDELYGGLDPTALPENITGMRHEGRRLSDSFMQLLTLYRIEQKRYTANISEHSVYDCLEEVVLENEPILAAKGITIELACDDGLMWYFDRALITGVINTLVNNAYRYARTKVALRARTHEQQLLIQIEDDGEGYPEIMLGRPDTMHSAIDFQTGGTGLGIHFAETIARLHCKSGQCGHVEIRNLEAGGGCFSLLLP